VSEESGWATHRPYETLHNPPHKIESEKDETQCHGPKEKNDRPCRAFLRIFELGQIIPETAEYLFAPQNPDNQNSYSYKIAETYKHISCSIDGLKPSLTLHYYHSTQTPVKKEAYIWITQSLFKS
jgi:hypothetical protein